MDFIPLIILGANENATILEFIFAYLFGWIQFILVIYVIKAIWKS